jgi:hypothetical protein
MPYHAPHLKKKSIGFDLVNEEATVCCFLLCYQKCCLNNTQNCLHCTAEMGFRVVGQMFVKVVSMCITHLYQFLVKETGPIVVVALIAHVVST